MSTVICGCFFCEHSYSLGSPLTDVHLQTMSPELTDEEIIEIKHQLAELMLEHRDLDDIVDSLLASGNIEELKIKRLKKRKLQIKDRITLLEDKLIPDILA